jgi:DNA polymerase-4
VLGGRPTDALWGIGAKTARHLAELGIHTVRELAAADPDVLARRFGPATGPWLVLIAQGHGAREVDDTPYQARSHGREITFQEDIADWSQVPGEITRLAEVVAGELAGGERAAVRVVVKVRYAPFITQTHGQALAAPTTDPAAISQAALAALDRFTDRRPVRLLGVRAEFAP